MIELMEKEGHNIPEECNYDTDEGDNSIDVDDSDEEYD